MSNEEVIMSKIVNPEISLVDRLKRFFENKMAILIFLIPAFVPVTLLIFIPLFFSIIITIFTNPTLDYLGKLPTYYSNLGHLANYKWGDFFYFIAYDTHNKISQFFLLMVLLDFVFFTFLFYRIFLKLGLGKKYKFSPFLIAILLSYVTPYLFYYFYKNILISFFDGISNISTKINSQLGFWLTYIPLSNIQIVLNTDQVQFLDILLNTLVWTVTCVFFHVVLGILLALLMNKQFPGRSLFRTIFILPWAIPQFVTALIWRNFIFSYDQGLLGKPVEHSYTSNKLVPFSYTILDFLITLIVLLCWILLILATMSVLKNIKVLSNRLFIAFITCLPYVLYFMMFGPPSFLNPFILNSPLSSIPFSLSIPFTGILILFILLIVFLCLVPLKRLENRLFIAFVICFPFLILLMIFLPNVIYTLTDALNISSIFGYKIINVPQYSDNFWFIGTVYVFGRPFNMLLFSAIIVNIWLGVPFMMVSFLAALQSIPQDLYEAAKMDGADTFSQFRTITLPLIKPTLFIVSLLGFVWTFNLFNVVYILSQNWNGLSTRNDYDIFVTYIYYFFNARNNYALASALSVVVFLILVSFTWFYRRLLNPDKLFEGDKKSFRS